MIPRVELALRFVVICPHLESRAAVRRAHALNGPLIRVPAGTSRRQARPEPIIVCDHTPPAVDLTDRAGPNRLRPLPFSDLNCHPRPVGNLGVLRELVKVAR